MQKNDQGTRYAEALASELKWQLKGLDITGSTVAGMLDVAPQTVGVWLNGRSKIPFTFAYTAALVMGARPSSLFELADKRLATESTLLTTGTPEMREPTNLTPEQLQTRGLRFLDCVAAELRTQLADSDMSVRQVALKLGKAPTVAGEWLSGKKVLPVHFAYNICQTVGLPIGDLVDRAEARIDLYPEDDDEFQNATTELSESTPPLPPRELSRRLRALLEIQRLDDAQGLDLVMEAAGSLNVQIEPEQWTAALDGNAVPSRAFLEVVGEAFETPLDYLTIDDDDVTTRVEAEAELARAATEAGVTTIAARGPHLSTQTLLEIANLVNRYIPK